MRRSPDRAIHGQPLCFYAGYGALRTMDAEKGSAGNGGTEGLFALPPLADIRPANPLKPVTKMQQTRPRREAPILTVKNFKTSLVLCAATIHIALTASGSRGPYRRVFTRDSGSNSERR